MNIRTLARRCGALVLAAMVGFAPVSASAAGGYFGASIGGSSYDESTVDGLITSGYIEPEDTGFKIYGGAQLTDNLGFEVAYVDLGEARYGGSFFGTSVTNGRVEVSGVDLSLIGSLPLNPGFSLFGKVGMFFWDGESNDIYGGSPSRITDSGEDLSFGFGLRYDFGRNVGLRAEWEFFNFGDADADMLSIGLYVRF